MSAQSKLDDLMEMEGLTEEEAFTMASDSVQPGICKNELCEYTTEVEPDQEEGYCEDCNTNTVISLQCLLMEVI